MSKYNQQKAREQYGSQSGKSCEKARENIPEFGSMPPKQRFQGADYMESFQPG